MKMESDGQTMLLTLRPELADNDDLSKPYALAFDAGFV